MADRRSPATGLIPLSARQAFVLHWVAVGLSAVALLLFATLIVREGVPRRINSADWEMLASWFALGVTVLGLALAWKWAGVGGALIVVGSMLFGMVVPHAYRPVQEAWACLAFLVPGLMLLLAWQRRHRPRALGSVVASLVAVLVLGGVLSSWAYGHYLGPTHPASSARAFPVDLVEWAWAGAATTDRFTVKAKLAEDGPVGLLVSEDEQLTDARRIEPVRPAGQGDVAEYRVGGLQPGVAYHYAFVQGEHHDGGRKGRIRTFPAGAASFVIAFGACQSTGSNGAVYDRIREADPLAFIVTGDYHYQNIDIDDRDAFEEAYERNLRNAGPQALYLRTAFVYTWDDHDWGGDGSNKTAKSRPAATGVYRDWTPHYPLPEEEGDGAIYHSFEIGRVLFIVTDTRSERDPSSVPMDRRSMLGAKQKVWFEEQLLRGRDEFGLIVWVNGVPWIDEVQDGADSWGGFPAEREEIANFIAANGIDNLAVISGDAHMLAIDDGTNSNYATSGDAAFPVFQAAALDRRGSEKGGPFSHGTFPGGGHFGLMSVKDDGQVIRVSWSGRTWEGEELVSHTFSR